MTSTFADATARVQALLDALADGSWTPSTAESTCAAVILTAPPRTPPADAVVEGLRAAGPDVAPVGGQAAPALVQCARLLRASGFAVSKEGQELRAALNELLTGMVAATVPPPWAVRLLQEAGDTRRAC
jgi:hypothetical protein